MERTSRQRFPPRVQVPSHPPSLASLSLSLSSSPTDPLLNTNGKRSLGEGQRSEDGEDGEGEGGESHGWLGKRNGSEGGRWRFGGGKEDADQVSISFILMVMKDGSR